MTTNITLRSSGSPLTNDQVDANFSELKATADAALPLAGGDLSGPVTTNSTIDGRNVSVDGAKLDGIEASATADQTAAELLTAIKTVDGPSSGLNADQLDSQDGSYYTAYADAAVAAIVDSSPAALNTLNELASALGDDSNFSTTVTNSIATKLSLAGGDLSGPVTTNSTFDGRNVSVDGTKLDGIEASATADQTNAEIRTAVEAASDSNVFTDADHNKLNAIEASATADQTDAEIRAAVEAASDSNVFTDADHSKLNAVEAGATADQTGAQIKTAYEAETSAFTDAQFTKLSGIESSATADQTNAEIRTAVEAATDSNVFTDADHTKLNGLETSADATDTENVELAGALMDSEVTNLAEVKAFDSTDYATALQGAKADAALPKAGGLMSGAITTNSTFDGRDVATDGAKLDDIEANADVTDTDNVVASLTAGSGISLSAGGSIANTAPDQTVALTGAGTTSVSGTYPNFTITGGGGSTYTAGSGLSLTGLEFANTAPDQTVALTGAGTTSVTGSYPNFTITSTDTDTVYTHPSAHAISFITGLQTALNGKVDDGQVLTDVPSGAVFTDTNTTYTSSDFNHDNLTGFVANEHIDWSADQGSTTIHAGNYTNTTYSVGDGELSQNNFTNEDHSKLDGIATGATNTEAPHYTSAIAVGAGGLTQQNFTTTLKNKLDGIAASANNYVLPSGYATETYVGTQISNLVDSSPAALNTLNELAAALGDDANFSTTITTSIGTKLPLAGGALTGAVTTNSTFDGRDVSVDGTKLDGIETGATADQTGAQIKTAYEAQANAFTDAQFTKLSGIESSATADQTAAQIKTAYESNTNTQAFTDADHTKLDGIEASADVTDTNNVVASLTAGSGISLSASGVIASTSSYSLPVATNTVLGGVKLFSNTDQSVAANSVSTTASRTYGVQLNSADQTVVNVPWVNTTYTVGDGGLSQINFTSADHDKLNGIATGATNTAAPFYTSAIAVGAGGLTQQNFTTTLKTKLDGIATGANNYTIPSTVAYNTANFNNTQRIRFSANGTNNWDTIATSSGSQGSLEVFNTGAGNDAFMAFHAGSDYAGYFGLDADSNDLAWGGWSVGAVKHKMFHAGNSTQFTSTMNTKLSGIATGANNYSFPYTISTTSTANAVARRDGSGDIKARLFRSEYDSTNATCNYFMTQVDTASNNYMRPSTPAQVRASLNVANGATNTSAPYYTSAIAVGAGGLTQQNFTTTLKNKLDGIAASANNYVRPSTRTTYLATAGNDNGFGFWGGVGSYAIQMGNNQANHGTVTDYSMHHNMGATAGRGFTFGNSRTAVTCSINALTGAILSSNNITAYSDIRVKDNIEVIPNALDKVSQLSGYTFTRTDVEDKEQKYTGVIAQEVLKVLPEAVQLGATEEDTMSVAYGNMVGLMIEAIKELKSEIETLKRGG